MPTGMKRSRQREAILAYLKTRTDHPTADMVYTAMRESIPNISLGTVYRNLALLADNHMILRISCDGKADHYDANIQPHPHFICQCCGCVQDIETSLPKNSPIQYVSPDFPGQIEGCLLFYYGTCGDCLNT